jgi:hypothetical protein
MDGQAQESHGLFQFTTDFFEVEEVKIRHVTASQYTPTPTVIGGFLADLDVDQKFTEKIGPHQVLDAIHYHYMKREWELVLQLCDEYIAANETRQLNLNDVLDIASRACLKLEKVERAMDYISRANCTLPGLIFTKAHVCRLAGHHHLSIKLLLEYLDDRTNDYTAW